MAIHPGTGKIHIVPSIRNRLLPQPLHFRIEGAQTACVWQYRYLILMFFDNLCSSFQHADRRLKVIPDQIKHRILR